jgi:hypothetical protein
MSERSREVEHHPMSLSSHIPLSDPSLRPAPMPVAVPPVGTARARWLRLFQLREQVLAGGCEIDVDAVAARIARRAEFNRDLAARLAAGA